MGRDGEGWERAENEWSRTLVKKYSGVTAQDVSEKKKSSSELKTSSARWSGQEVGALISK